MNSGAVDDRPAVSTTNSPVELFKSFIASPPLIKELVFVEKTMPKGKPMTREQGLEISTNYQGYITRWQPNGRSVYQILAEPWLTNRLMNSFSMSAFDQTRWLISPSGGVVLWHETASAPDLKAGQERELGALKHKADRSTLDYLTYRLSEVLNMGVYGLEIGSIRWRGNSFCETNSNFGTAMKFEGTLQISDRVFPSELKLRCHIGTNDHDFSVLYTFERDIGVPYLPSKIRRIQSVDGKPREDQYIELKSILLAAEPAPEVAFQPDTNLLAVPLLVRYYTNDSYFVANSSGELIRSPVDLPPVNLNERRIAYLAVCAGVSLTIFALMVRAKTKQKQNRLYSEPKQETV